MAKYNTQQKHHYECLECGKSLAYTSRTNQKFCSSQCRYAYNNRKKVFVYKCRNKVENILQRNYLVLSEVLNSKHQTISISDAVIRGFNPAYMTSAVRYSSFVEYTCYDIAYRISDTKLFKIRRMSLNL